MIHSVFWFVLCMAAAGSAFAGPEVRVRVHGASRIEATAVATARGTELSGLVTDEAGRPVPDARVRVRLVTPSGVRRPLSRPQSCTAAAAPEAGARPSEAGDEALAETDSKGRFCLRWWDELPDGRLSLQFEDEHRLLDSSSLEVGVDRRPPIDLAFAPAPRALSSDEGSVTVVVQSRTRLGEAPDRAPLILSLVRGDQALELVRGELRRAEAVRLSFAGSLLGAPGPAELVATLELSERKSQARAPVLVTARVELQAPAEFWTDSAGEGQLRVTGQTAAGTAISSGSVEAQSEGRTIGIAKLEAGMADLHLALGAQPGTFPIRLRYLASAPWWSAAPERIVVVNVPKASLWKRLPWALAWAAVAAWILLAWRRPARREASRDAGEPAAVVEPTVEWVASEALADLWTGHVLDAHDAIGVAGARVSVAASDGRLRATITDAKGHFEIPASSALLAEGRIRVEAPLHASLERPLPPPGRLAITLVTRRRALLARLVAWASRSGSPLRSDREPTPAELAEAAGRVARSDVAVWAAAVEAAAFGAETVGAEQEARILALEPGQEPDHQLDPGPSARLPDKP